jgi:hypothetical protein
MGDYFKNKYGEILCNIQANEIIVVQQTAGKNLYFGGFGALSDCDCSKSQLDPSLFTIPPTILLASITSLKVKSTDAVQNILISAQIPDTVSSSCAPADGVSKCGPRSLNFTDKTTGVPVTNWPYMGFFWNEVTSILSVDSA